MVTPSGDQAAPLPVAGPIEGFQHIFGEFGRFFDDIVGKFGGIVDICIGFDERLVVQQLVHDKADLSQRREW